MPNDFLKEVTAGDPISATQQNQMIRSINKFRGAGGSFNSGALSLDANSGGVGEISASITGAFAIIKGEVPPAVGIDVSGVIEKDVKLVTVGELEAEFTESNTYEAGALIVNPDGTAAFDEEDKILVYDVINGSYSTFKSGAGGIMTSGTVITYSITGEDDKTQFVLPWPDPRGFRNYVKGKLQILFHEPNESDYSLDAEDCGT